MQYARTLAVMTAAAIVGLSGQANAQKVKPAKPDHDMKEMQKAAKESQKDAMKDAREQRKETTKAVKEEHEDAEKAAKAAREEHEDAAKAAKARTEEQSHAAKAEERAQHESFDAARQQSSRLTHGIKLTAAERRQFEPMRKQYDAQYKALEKQERQLDKAHQSDAVVLQQLETLRLQEQTTLRAFLTPEQQVIFDRNAAATTKRR